MKNSKFPHSLWLSIAFVCFFLLISFASYSQTCNQVSNVTHNTGVDRVYWDLNGSADEVIIEVDWIHYTVYCVADDWDYEPFYLSGTATYFDIYEHLGFSTYYSAYVYIYKRCGTNYSPVTCEHVYDLPC